MEINKLYYMYNLTYLHIFINDTQITYLGRSLTRASNILTHFFSLWMRLCSLTEPG